MLVGKGGVLFKGNLRGKADTSYEKIKKRLNVCTASHLLSLLPPPPPPHKKNISTTNLYFLNAG